MLSQEKLAEIQKALEAATPGPWNKRMGRVMSDNENFIGGRMVASIPYLHDAHLIANAPAWIQQLLETVKAKDAEIEWLRTEIEQLRTSEVFKVCLVQEELINETKAALEIAVEALEGANERLKWGSAESAVYLAGRILTEALDRINSKED